ncbi:hypothetical protein [Corynebacterium bouchesdurhonense]|uniref:hypothetical protein n=1 Tax=Corynebacterium bouchesdurhonense TaxID=1720192 RepID=UPI0016522E9A|nr:hypothetical protein [Corynebacterium bouchesdurhonense]
MRRFSSRLRPGRNRGTPGARDTDFLLAVFCAFCVFCAFAFAFAFAADRDRDGFGDRIRVGFCGRSS